MRLYPTGQTNWCLYVLAVIASQCSHWRGNPPVERNQVTITTKIATLSYSVGQSSKHLPLTGGLPHQRARWFAMTGNLEPARQTPICAPGLFLGTV